MYSPQTHVHVSMPEYRREYLARAAVQLTTSGLLPCLFFLFLVHPFIPHLRVWSVGRCQSRCLTGLADALCTVRYRGLQTSCQSSLTVSPAKDRQYKRGCLRVKRFTRPRRERPLELTPQHCARLTVDDLRHLGTLYCRPRTRLKAVDPVASFRPAQRIPSTVIYHLGVIVL